MIDGDLMAWWACDSFSPALHSSAECDVLAFNISTGKASEVSQRMGSQPKHPLVSQGRVLYRDLPGPGTEAFPTRLVMWTERTNESRDVAFPVDSIGGAADFEYPWVTFDARLNGTPYWFVGNVETLQMHPIAEILRDDQRPDGSWESMNFFVIHEGRVYVEHLWVAADKSVQKTAINAYDLDGRFVGVSWEGIDSIISLDGIQERLIVVRNPDVFLLAPETGATTVLHPGLGSASALGNAAKSLDEWVTVWLYDPSSGASEHFLIDVRNLSKCELPNEARWPRQDYTPYTGRLFFQGWADAESGYPSEGHDIYWIPMPEECRGT